MHGVIKHGARTQTIKTIATLKKIEQSNSPEVTFWEVAIDVQEKRTGTTSKTSWHDVDNMIPACEENKANPRLTWIHTIHRSHPSTVTVKALKRLVAPDTPAVASWEMRRNPRTKWIFTLEIHRTK